MLYRIQGTICTKRDGWALATQVPTFFLNGEVQGITSVSHAERVARTILNPFGDEALTIEVEITEAE